jgi:predicted transcriptional regulator
VQNDPCEGSHTDNLLNRAIDLVSAYVMNNHVEQSQIMPLIRDIYSGLCDLKGKPVPQLSTEGAPTGPRPAVPISDSFDDDHLWCLECGEKMTMLKRHLRSQHTMTIAEYREKWDLPQDYPAIALNYSRKRSKAAMANGLGRKTKT